MSVRTQKPPTEVQCTLAFVGPVAHAEAARTALYALGFAEAETRETVPWREVFPPIPEAERPGRMLRAARTAPDMRASRLGQDHSLAYRGCSASPPMGVSTSCATSISPPLLLIHL